MSAYDRWLEAPYVRAAARDGAIEQKAERLRQELVNGAPGSSSPDDSVPYLAPDEDLTILVLTYGKHEEVFRLHEPQLSATDRLLNLDEWIEELLWQWATEFIDEYEEVV